MRKLINALVRLEKGKDKSDIASCLSRDYVHTEWADYNGYMNNAAYAHMYLSHFPL